MKGLSVLVGLFLVAGMRISCASEFRLVPNVRYLEPGRTEKLDLYLPARGPTDLPTPAVIWIHGRGHDKGDARERNVCETLAGAGYVCASINHRPWTTDLRDLWRNTLDAKNAVRFLRVHAAEYHVDPARIAIFGGSAGGTLALMVGFTSGEAQFEPTEPYPGTSSAVSAIGDFYGSFDWFEVPAFKQQLPPMSASALAALRLLEPVTHFSPKSPPILIVHGKDDPMCDYHQSVELDQMATADQVPHELVLMEGVGHGFDLSSWKGHPLPCDLRAAVLAFLGRYLGPPTVSTAEHRPTVRP